VESTCNPDVSTQDGKLSIPMVHSSVRSTSAAYGSEHVTSVVLDIIQGTVDYHYYFARSLHCLQGVPHRDTNNSVSKRLIPESLSHLLMSSSTLICSTKIQSLSSKAIYTVRLCNHPLPHRAFEVYHLKTEFCATNTMSQTKILLLGAGELGTAFLPHIYHLPNTTVTIGVRSPANYTQLTSSYLSLTILPIDLSLPSAQLTSIFAGYDILMSATGFGADPTTVLKLANEVLDAGKIKKEGGQGKLWFFPWQWGVDYDVTGDGQGLMPLFGAQRDVRNLQRAKAAESNVTWTVVSTGIFMSFLFEPFWGIVDRSREASEKKIVVRCLKDWEHRVTVTDVNDIGRVLSRILIGDVEAENRVLYVAGDTVSYGELAQIVGRVSGKEVVEETWGVAKLEKELAKDPEDGIKKYRLVFARDGVWWNKENTVNAQLGMTMLGVEKYTEKVLGKSRRDL
jgi:hypothetical protein